MSKRALVPPHKSRSERPSPTPREIFGYLDEYVVGQERAKRAVAIAAYNHVKRCAQPKDRSLRTAPPFGNWRWGMVTT